MPADERPADILYEDALRISFAASDRVLGLLRHRKVFLGLKHDFVPPPGTTIDILKSARLEDYCAFPFARRLYTNGAFSYSQSVEHNLVVGRYCSIGPHVSVLGERHPLEWVTTSPVTYHFKPHLDKPAFSAAHADLMGDAFQPLKTPVRFEAPPIIGNDVWIGQDVLLARGITIGTGAVIGAGSVVTRSVEPYAIVGGNPARTIRMRFPAAVVARLLEAAWWDYHPNLLFRLDARQPESFLEGFERLRDAGSLQKLQLATCTWRDFI